MKQVEADITLSYIRRELTETVIDGMPVPLAEGYLERCRRDIQNFVGAPYPVLIRIVRGPEQFSIYTALLIEGET